jgi:hypothetical protein
MKKIITTTILTTVLFYCGPAFSKDYRYVTTQVGSGYTKGDALATALIQLPYGAQVKKVDFNGYSIRQCVPGAGYVQTYGSYKCKVTYSNK